MLRPVLLQPGCRRPHCVKPTPPFMLGQTDGQTNERTPYRYIDPLRILCGTAKDRTTILELCLRALKPDRRRITVRCKDASSVIDLRAVTVISFNHTPLLSLSFSQLLQCLRFVTN